MAITCVFPALLAIPIIQALSFYTQHRKVECGSKLFIEGSYAIPRINACSFIVEVPNKTAVQITISGRGFNCKQHAEDLMIESMNTKAMSFPCYQRDGAALFSGEQEGYVVHTRNLPSPTHIGISYYSTQFTCGDSVPFDVVGMPLSLKLGCAQKGECSVVLPGRSRVVVDRVEGESACIRFMQGTRLGDFALESEDVCVAANDEQELRYDILCSIGLMTVTSSETTVHFHLEGPTPDELRSYRSQSYICSHRFVD